MMMNSTHERHHHRQDPTTRTDNPGSSSLSARHPPPPPSLVHHRTPQELYRPPRSRPSNNTDGQRSSPPQQQNHRQQNQSRKTHHHRRQTSHRYSGGGGQQSTRYQRRQQHSDGSKYHKNLARFDQMKKYPNDAVLLTVNKYNLNINLHSGEKLSNLNCKSSISISLSELILIKSITMSTTTNNNQDIRKKPKAGIIVINTGTSISKPSEPNKTTTTSHKFGGLIRLNPESMELLQQHPGRNHHHHGSNITVSSSSDHHRSGRSDFHRWEDLLDEIRYHTHRKRGGMRRVHNDPGIAALRNRVMSACEQLLLSDLNRSTSNNVLPNCWDTCFYDFIRMYRGEDHHHQTRQQQQQNSKKSTEDSSLLLSSLTKDGLEYFGSLYHKLLSRYNFPSMKILYDRHRYYKINPNHYSHLHDVTYIVKIIFIYLGDLWRYIEYGQQQNYFQNSKNYYMKAHMLVPKNSHVLSQLSLVSFYQKNYFDAIYYYIVSLDYEILTDSSSVKFLTKHLRILSNRQNLVVFYDSVRFLYLKYHTGLKREYDSSMEQCNRIRQRNERGHSRINKYHRIEYWIRPNKTVSKCDMYNFYDLATVNSNEDDPGLLKFYQDNVLKKLSFKDLKDRFVASFLMVHGMLSYRTDLDRFFDVANQMVLEFDQLLTESFDINRKQQSGQQQTRLTSLFLIQLIVINMFTVMNTFNDDRTCDYQNSACYGFTHRNAYFIMSIMMSMILKRLISVFDSFRWKHNDFINEPNKYQKKKPALLEKEPESVEDFFGSVYSTERISESSSNVHNPQIDQQKIDDWIEFYTLLPCVKLWSDWTISYNPYFPPNDMNDIKTNIDHQNIWEIFAEFLTLLHQIKQYPVSFYVDEKSKAQLSLSSPKTNNPESKEEYELVQLPEDRCLDGFKILRDAPESSKYVKLPFVAEISYIYMRIESIKLFGDYLCGLRYPYLKFDPKTNRFDSLIHGDDIENQPGVKLKQIQQQQFQEAIARYKKYYGGVDITTNVTNEDDGYSDDEEAINEINSLKLCPSERRKLLQYRMLRQRNAVHGRYFQMLEHISEPKRRFIIRPRYVVFDTNCFINDLSTIVSFIRQPAPFTVTVPLIVIQELRYMQSRDNGSTGDQKMINLSAKAKEILGVIEDSFQRKRNIKAVTSKGSLLDDINYKEELSSNPDVFNNDDLVLYACENLIKDQGQISPSHDQSLRRLLEDSGERNLGDQDEIVYRDVVLITDDMNLRIKSLGYDIPVKKFKQFRKWTNTLVPPVTKSSQPHR